MKLAVGRIVGAVLKRHLVEVPRSVVPIGRELSQIRDLPRLHSQPWYQKRSLSFRTGSTGAKARSPTPPPHPSRWPLTYSDLELALRRRGYSLYRLLLASFSSVAVLLVLFWPNIKQWGAQESAQVASQTLEDVELQQRASDLAKQVARALLSDEETSESLKKLLEAWMADPQTVDLLAGFLEGVGSSVMEREEVREQVAVFTAELLTWPVVQDRAAELAIWVTQQPAVLQAGRDYLKTVLDDENSRRIGKEYASWAMIEALRAESTRKTTQDGLEAILADAGFRQAAGDALWTAAKSGIFGGRVDPKVDASREPEKSGIELDRGKDRHKLSPQQPR